MNSFSKEICDTLNAELQIYQRQGPGGNYPYHKGTDVIKQMNKAFGHCWSSTVITEQEKHSQVLVLVSVSVQLENQIITHQGFGSALIAKKRGTDEVIDIGNSYKSAFTTALKKACEQFGIGLTGDETAEVDNSPPSGGYSKSSYTPSAAQKTNTYTPSRTAPTSAPTTAVARPAFANRPPSSAPSSRSPVMSRASMAPVSSAPDAATITGASSEVEKITNPQIVAIKTLATAKKLTEAELISQGLGSSDRPTANLLTKAEATRVIKYANSLA